MKPEADTRQPIELEPGHRYPFQWKHPRYGRAEFTVCTVYRYGKLREFYMYPMQQENADYYYHAAFDFPPESWSVASWSGLDAPKVWINFWCKEHKCPSSRLYVPNGSQWFQPSFLSSFSIYFGPSS